MIRVRSHDVVNRWTAVRELMLVGGADVVTTATGCLCPMGGVPTLRARARNRDRHPDEGDALDDIQGTANPSTRPDPTVPMSACIKVAHGRAQRPHDQVAPAAV